MLSFRSASIRRKLTLLMIMTSSVALLVASAFLMLGDLIGVRRDMVDNLGSLARITGANCTAALSFGVKNSAEDTLSALKARPPIVAACLYAKDGSLFATYIREGSARYFTAPKAPPPEGSHFVGGHLD